jgi:hypothetical protein
MRSGTTILFSVKVTLITLKYFFYNTYRLDLVNKRIIFLAMEFEQGPVIY